MHTNIYVSLPTEYTEWQWLLSGVHSIMMVKSSQPGEGGGCMPTPFHSVYHHKQSCGVRSNWEGRCTPPPPPRGFLLYPYMYSVSLPTPSWPCSCVDMLIYLWAPVSGLYSTYEYLYTLEPDERGVTRNLKNRRNAMRRGFEQELRRVGLLKRGRK